MKSIKYILILFNSVLVFTECDHSSPLVKDPAAYIASVEQWQQDRLESLKGKKGWLNLAGIYWLKDGVQTFGSDSANDIVFPAKAPAFMGSLTLKDELVRLSVNENVELFYEDKAINELELTYDSRGDPSYITHGDFAWYIIVSLPPARCRHPRIAWR